MLKLGEQAGLATNRRIFNEKGADISLNSVPTQKIRMGRPRDILDPRKGSPQRQGAGSLSSRYEVPFCLLSRLWVEVGG